MAIVALRKRSPAAIDDTAPMPATRRFPPPCTVEETAPCFIVRDHNGQALAFVYCEDEPGRRSTGKLLTRDEAQRIATNIALLPELLRQKEGEGEARRGCSRTLLYSSRNVRITANSRSIAATHYLTSWASSGLMHCKKLSPISEVTGSLPES